MADASPPQRAIWEHIYAGHATPSIWGNEPVPGALMAAEIARKMHRPRILDAGCGDGRNLRVLASNGLVVGTDVSREALARARQVLSEEASRRTVLAVDDVCEPLFEPGSFDIVICLEVLSHVIEIEQALQSLFRLLAPGGVLVGDFFTVDDATCGSVLSQGPTGGYDAIGVYSRYMTEEAARALLDSTLQVGCAELRKSAWFDPPHPGVREYRHRHETWTFVIEK